jgi:hypothetical protein
MNSDNFTDQEIVQLACECIVHDDFTTFSTTVLSCRRREGTSPSEMLRQIERAIFYNGTEEDHDKFRQFKMSVDGAAGELADITNQPKHKVMEK